MRNQFIEDKDKGFIVRKKINEDFLKLFIYTDTPFLSSNSLTLNYLPKYNNDHALINSVVYDDGSKVGIGTNSPISKLEVVGENIVGYSNASNSHTGIVVRNNNNASWTIDGRLIVDTVNTPNKVIIGSWTNHPLQIITNNTQRMWVDSWGVSTTGNLSVSGDVIISGSLSALGDITRIETRMYTTSSVNIRNSGSDTALIVKQTGTQDIATFFDDNNVILSLKDGGNVGIGTSTSVNEKLTVAGGNISIDNNYGLKWSANTDTASIRFESTWDNAGFSKLILETTDNEDEPIVLRQSGLDRLYVGTGGNVGIGTSAPNEKLTVIGSISAVGNNISNTFSNTDTPAFGGLKGFRLFNKDTSQDSVGGILSIIADPNGITRHTGAIVFGRDGTWTSTNYPGYVSLWTRPYDSSAEVERMRIDSTGNVGIGTTTPGVKLDVAGTIAANYLRLDAQDGGAEGGEIQLKGAGTYGDLQIDNHSGNLRLHTLNTGNHFQILGGHNTTALRVEDGGVYIGSFASGNTNSVIIESSGTLQKRSIDSRVWGTSLVDGTGTANRVAYWTGSNTIAANSNFFFDGTNVGIGTPTPGYLLDVYKDLDVWHTKIGGATGVLRIGGQTMSGAVIQAYNPTTSTVRDMYLQRDGGNVGIGTTTTSTAKVTIFKSGGGNALYLNGNGFSTTPTSIIASTYDTNWTNGAPATIQFIDDGTFGNHIAFRTKITGAAGNADAERMRITTSGNVGIGTTNPAYKLDVDGDAIVRGWLRTTGSQGWYSQTHDGGWYMADTTWVRSYNQKSVWIGSGLLGSDGGLTIGYGGISPSYNGAIIAGNVGIGTSTPGSDDSTLKLDVYGRSRFYTTLANVFQVVGKGSGYADAANGIAKIYSENTSGSGGWVLNAGSAFSPNLFVVKDNNEVAITANTTNRPGLNISNINAGTGAHTLFSIGNDTSVHKLLLFTNSSTRTTDGGAGNSTIRTDSGSLLLGADGVTRHIISSNGGVGIGSTSTPTGSLDVTGNAYFNKGRIGGSNHVTIRGYQANQNYGVLAFTTSGPLGTSDVNIATIAGLITSHAVGSESGGLQFGTVNAGVASEKMRLDPSGKLGIGTTSPQRALHVFSNDIFPIKLESSNTNTTALEIYNSSSTRTWENAVAGTVNLAAIPSGSYYIYDQGVGAGARMVINTSGNVGIGAITPNEKLTIVGNLSATGTGTFKTVNANTTSNDVLVLGADNKIEKRTLTIWNAGSSGLLGNSLTTNYITKYSGTNTVSNSLIYDNGTNVGIGTTSPVDKLSVNGSIYIEGGTSQFNPGGVVDSGNLTNTYLTFGTAGAGNDWAYLRQIGGDNAYNLSFDMHDDGDSSGAGQSFSIRSIGSAYSPDPAPLTRFHIDGNGNVGIGTTSTSTAKTTIFKSGGGNALYLNGNGFSTTPTSIIASTYDTNWTNGAPATIQFIDDGTYGNHIAFRTKITGAAGNADAERMRITTSGNVGIGQTNPYFKLEVIGNTLVRPYSQTASSEIVAGDALYVDVTNPGAGTTNWSGTLLRQYGKTATGTSFGFSNAGLGMLLFQNTENCIIGTNSGSLPLIFANAYGEKMRIANTGNVGIGSSAHMGYGKLSIVDGSAAGITSQIFIGPVDGGLGRESAISFGATFSNGWGGADFTQRVSGKISYGAYNAGADPRDLSMKFFTCDAVTGTDTPTERMRINSSGNVGIGTPAPSHKLHVSDNTTTGDVRIGLGTGVNSLELIRNGANDNWVRSFGGEFIIDQQANNSLTFRTNAQPRMTILGGGSVLINTSTTDDSTLKLDVYGRSRFYTTLANVFRVVGKGSGYADATNGIAKIYSENTSGSGGWVLNAGSAFSPNLFVVKDNNEVAITANTTYRAYLNIRNTNAGTGAHTLFSMGNDTNWNKLVIVVNSSTRTDDGGAGNTTIRTDSGSLLLGAGGATQHILSSNGGFGIGSISTPTGALDVTGNAYFNKGRIGGSNHVTIRGYQAGMNYGVLAFTTSGPLGTSDVNIATIAGLITSHTAGSESGGFTFGTLNAGVASEKMRLDPSGSLGIGITPTQKLHVVESGDGGANGTALFSSAGSNASIRIDSASTSYHAYQTFSQGGVGKFELGINNASDFYINPTVQFSSNGAAIYIKKSDGNVGIGTVPGVKLDVAGTIAADYLRLDAQDGGAEGGEIQLKGAGTYGDLQIDNHSGNLRLHTLGLSNHFQILGGHNTTALRVEDGGAFILGNVGIGQTNPYYKLEVQGGSTLARPSSQTLFSEIVAGDALFVDVTNPGAGTTNWSGTLLRQYGKTATGSTYGVPNAGLGMLLFQNTDNCIIGTNSGSLPLIFANANGEKMRIASDGRVGINKTNPTYMLDVLGGQLGGTLGNTMDLARFGNYNSNANFLRIYQRRFATGVSWNTAETRIQQTTDNTDQTYISFSPDGDGGMAFGTGSAASEKMRLDPNGSLGIGTTNPNEKLTVSGNISATGNVYTSEGGFVRNFNMLYDACASKLHSQIGQDIDGEAASDQSGYSVSMNAAGDRVAIGAYLNDGNGSGSGHVRIYSLSGTAWTQLGLDINGEATGNQSGMSVSMNAAGDRVAIGAPLNQDGGNSIGQCRIYSWSGSTWVLLADINGEASNDQSGWSVSMNAVGDRVAIGSRYNDGNGSSSGHVRIYYQNGLVWNRLGSVDIDGEAASDQSGWSVSMNAAGDRVAIGAPYNDGNGTSSGHVRIYSWNGTAWTQLGSVDIDGEAADDRSGYSVSMNAAGDRVAIGAYLNDGNGSSSGHVRIYSWNGSVWTQLGSVDINGEAGGDQSGYSVSMNAAGDRVAIGAIYNDGNGSASGQVRIYSWNGAAWTKLGLDIDGETSSDQSGWSVSMNAAGDRVAIGAPLNDGNGSSSGHVRIYHINDNDSITPTPKIRITETVEITKYGSSDPALTVGGKLSLRGLPTYSNNTTAKDAGLIIDDVYKTSTGELRIVI